MTNKITTVTELAESIHNVADFLQIMDDTPMAMSDKLIAATQGLKALMCVAADLGLVAMKDEKANEAAVRQERVKKAMDAVGMPNSGNSDGSTLSKIINSIREAAKAAADAEEENGTPSVRRDERQPWNLDDFLNRPTVRYSSKISE